MVVLAGKSGDENTTHIALNYPNGTQYTFGDLNGTVHALVVLQDNVYVAGQFEGSTSDLSARSFVVYNLSNRTTVLSSPVYGKRAGFLLGNDLIVLVVIQNKTCLLVLCV